MKKVIKLTIILLLLGIATGVKAQVSNQITTIIGKSEKVMTNPQGVETVMDIKMGVSIFKAGGSAVKCEKGDKYFSNMTMKVLGHKLVEEEGFDGKQYWKFVSSGSKNNPDTLFIAPAKKKEYGDDIDINCHKYYSKGEIKLKKDKYFITFTSPKNDELPSKVEFCINKNNYHPVQFDAKKSGVSMTMTVKSIKFGVSDNVFTLDMKKYPNAKIIRRKTL